MSFSYDYTTYDNDGTVDQGTLASSYTNALSAYLADEGADYVAFLANVAGVSINDALALKDAVAVGNFTLSGLFAASQTKIVSADGTYTVDGADPIPTLTVTVGETTYTIDLTSMMNDLDTETWSTITKKTGEIFHTREYYSTAGEPVGYDAKWSLDNQPPTAEAIVWGVAEYDDVNGGTQYSTIDLLTDASANDHEGGDLTVTFTETLPDYITYADGKLVIDTDSSELDHLPAGEKLELSYVYQISDDAGNTIDNTVSLTITGTNDVATISGTATGEVTEDGTTEITGLNITVDDPDDGESSFQEVTNLDGTYGSFTFNESTGDWGYTLNNDSDLVQAIKYYETEGDTLTVTSLDGTDTQNIEVTIQGTADQYHYTLSTATTQTVSDTGDGSDPNVAGVDDGTITLALTGVDANAFDYSGSVDVSVTGDINKTSGSLYDQEWVLATTDGGDSAQLGPVAYTGTATNNMESVASYTSDSDELNFASADNQILVTYDATSEVKDFTVTASISEFDYWV